MAGGVGPPPIRIHPGHLLLRPEGPDLEGGQAAQRTGRLEQDPRDQQPRVIRQLGLLASPFFVPAFIILICILCFKL